MFKSVGHFFATVYSKALGIEQKTIKALPAVEGTESTVEAVSATIPVFGPLALPVEKLGYAVLGEISAILQTGDTALKSKLLDAGLDSAVVASVEDLVNKIPQYTALIPKA